jgi:hypothetical protein
MLKIRLLAIAAAFGLVTLVGCGPTASTALDKAKEAAKEGADKAKEGLDKAVDKTKEVAKEGADKVKEGWDKVKETVGKWKEGYDKDMAAIDTKVKELNAKKAAAKTPDEIKAAEKEFNDANGLMDQIKVAIKDSFDKIKDGTAWEEFKKNVEPKIAELKKKLGIN